MNKLQIDDTKKVPEGKGLIDIIYTIIPEELRNLILLTYYYLFVFQLRTLKWSADLAIKR